MFSFDNLKIFFERIKSIGFWQRLFGWRSVKALSYDAYDEFKRISDQVEELNQLIGEQKSSIAELEKANEIKGSRLEALKFCLRSFWIIYNVNTGIILKSFFGQV